MVGLILSLAVTLIALVLLCVVLNGWFGINTRQYAILIGGYYTQHPDNPFLQEHEIVEVLDVKNGWVKYKFKNGGSSTLLIKTFCNVYKPLIGYKS